MKNRSYQKRLLQSFLIAGVVPLVCCVCLILAIFLTTTDSTALRSAHNRLSAMTEALGETMRGEYAALDRLATDGRIVKAMRESVTGDTEIYRLLYAAGTPGTEISLCDWEGHVSYTTGAGRLGSTLPLDWGTLEAARGKQETVCRCAPLLDGQEDSRVQLARAVYSGEALVGYVLADLDEAFFGELLEDKYAAGGDVMVLDSFWDEIYRTPGLGEEDLAETLRSVMLDSRRQQALGADYHYCVAREEDSGFFLVLRQLRPLHGSMLGLLYGIAAASILLCLLLCLWFSMAFSRSVFEPIRSLNAAMARVEGGDLTARLPVADTDELSQLSARFNRMTERLRENLQDSVRQQRELGNAKLRMMQAQLNPHFLYNTLDTLKWLGKIHRVGEVSTISADLADILRHSITGDEFVPLREELALLERYVEIQKIRFPGKFEYRAQAEEAALNLPVPKLMLQPLVENAIIHGFEDGSRGEILVSAVRHGGELVLEVRDNGCGLSEESLAHFRARESEDSAGRAHLGLYNVDAILRSYYGEHYGLQILPLPRGTCMRIVLPAGSESAGKPAKGE